jgi:hypothetical protein
MEQFVDIRSTEGQFCQFCQYRVQNRAVLSTEGALRDRFTNIRCTNREVFFDRRSTEGTVLPIRHSKGVVCC